MNNDPYLCVCKFEDEEEKSRKECRKVMGTKMLVKGENGIMKCC